MGIVCSSSEFSGKRDAAGLFFNDVGGVHSPTQVLRDMQSEELKVYDLLHLLPVDAQA